MGAGAGLDVLEKIFLLFLPRFEPHNSQCISKSLYRQCCPILHCEHGCSIDTTQLMLLITVGCFVMREVGSAAV